MTTLENALKVYNSRYNNNLYRTATKGKTAQYGCKLQDNVISILQGNGPTMKRIAPAAQKFVNWMTN
jgi:hypothetical protein